MPSHLVLVGPVRKPPIGHDPSPPGTTPEGQGAPSITLLKQVAKALGEAASRGDITKADIKNFGFGFSFDDLIWASKGKAGKIARGLSRIFDQITALQKAAGGRGNVTFRDLGVGLTGFRGSGTRESFGLDLLSFGRRAVNKPDFADTVIATERAAAGARNQARVERGMRKFFDTQTA